MITRNTVLILGAGASAPFGFPLGRDLMFTVIRSLYERHHPITQQLMNLGHTEGVLYRFARDLRDSQQLSVDAFLELRPEYMDIGKAAIACVLLPCENEEKLARQPNSPTWCEFLFSKLFTTLSDFEHNRLSIITFNYDRSLEQLLYTALKASYGMTSVDAAQKQSTLEVLHVYGKLGNHPYFEWRIKMPEVESEVSSERLQEAMDGIQLLSEKTESSPNFSRAHTLLEDADYVVFLGFGYHRVNVERLGLHRVTHGGLLGTAYGLKAGEREFVKQQMPGSIFLGEENQDILDFLRSNTLLAKITKPTN